MTNFLLDKEIFCDQVIRNQETMFHTAKAILHQDEDAEDAVQEAICAAYAGRGSLRDPARFRPWILKILVNKCYEFCRKRWTWRISRTSCRLRRQIRRSACLYGRRSWR